MNPFEESQIISPQIMQLVFSGIEELVKLHEAFLTVLKERFSSWNEDQKLGDLFIYQVPFSSLNLHRRFHHLFLFTSISS